LPRPGQTKIVSIYQILARGTVDERALSVLADKGTNQDRIIQAVLAEIDKG
jgi:SNF2 family DNA or RNA helicase